MYVTFKDKKGVQIFFALYIDDLLILNEILII
jgi:hypothetical protein